MAAPTERVEQPGAEPTTQWQIGQQRMERVPQPLAATQDAAGERAVEEPCGPVEHGREQVQSLILLEPGRHPKKG
jgi:hypothetical protein